jgi:hypothetical protein
VTELVVEQIVAGAKPVKLDALFANLGARARTARTIELARETTK